MNLAQLEATVQANKVPIMGTAAAGVAALALYRKHKAAAVGATAGSSADGTTGATSPAGVVLPYSAGGQTAGAAGGVYDSTSADLAGYLGPQLEAIGNAQTALQQLLTQQQSATPVPAAPVPAAAPVAAPAPAAAPPPTPVSAGPSYAVSTYYTVKPGDSLSKIAARYPQQDITAQSIYNANRGVIGGNINLIRPGQSLLIQG